MYKHILIGYLIGFSIGMSAWAIALYFDPCHVEIREIFHR